MMTGGFCAPEQTAATKHINGQAWAAMHDVLPDLVPPLVRALAVKGDFDSLEAALASGIVSGRAGLGLRSAIVACAEVDTHRGPSLVQRWLNAAGGWRDGELDRALNHSVTHLEFEPMEVKALVDMGADIEWPHEARHQQHVITTAGFMAERRHKHLLLLNHGKPFERLPIGCRDWNGEPRDLLYTLLLISEPAQIRCERLSQSIDINGKDLQAQVKNTLEAVFSKRTGMNYMTEPHHLLEDLKPIEYGWVPTTVFAQWLANPLWFGVLEGLMVLSSHRGKEEQFALRLFDQAFDGGLDPVGRYGPGRPPMNLTEICIRSGSLALLLLLLERGSPLEMTRPADDAGDLITLAEKLDRDDLVPLLQSTIASRIIENAKDSIHDIEELSG